MKKNFDPFLYFVVDPACCGGRDVVDVVMDAVRGGVSLVQYRDKSGDMPKIAAHAAMLAELLKEVGVPLIINDYVDIAVAASADGVHLGQGDGDPKVAREALGIEAIVGQTAFTPLQIKTVDACVIDYIGTGPVYPTQTDKGKPVLGLETFAEYAALSHVPVIGIGGITPVNARGVLDAGADGVAMMRSISEAPDVEAAARRFVRVL